MLIYVMCMEYRALTQTKRRHDKMADAWDDLERQLRVARATATMEHRIREQHAAKAEEENVRQQQVAARLQEELASVKAENSVRMCPPACLLPGFMPCSSVACPCWLYMLTFQLTRCAFGKFLPSRRLLPHWK